MILVFIGSPYAGKGTQVGLISKKFGIPVFSMGNLIREAYKEGNPKAVEGFTNYSMKGLHLPISLKFDLLKERIDLLENGFILDNFPATKEDLETFLPYLKQKSKNIDKVFYINISKEEMLKRMIFRGREDDKEEIVLKRREVQDQDRIPVIEYFKKEGILEEINGEKPIPLVQEEIISCLNK